MVDKAAEIQKRKDLCMKLTLAAQSLNRKQNKYKDYDMMVNEASVLADSILASEGSAEINVNSFMAAETLPLLKEYGKTEAVLTHVTSGYVVQGPIDKFLSSDECALHSVTFKESELTYCDYGSKEKYGNVSELSFENVLMNGHISHDLPQGNLTRLSFERCRMERSMRHDENETERTTIGSNAIETASRNPLLKQFYMNEMSLLAGNPEKEKPLEWETLPEALEYLSLAKTNIIYSNFDGLTAYLSSAKNMKAVDIASCGLTDEHGEKLLSCLEGTKIKLLNLSGNHFSDEMRSRLSAMVGKKVMVSPHYEALDKEKTIKEISYERPLKDHLSEAKNKAEMKEKNLFFPAVRGGVFVDVLDAVRALGEELSPEEYQMQDKTGKTLINELSKTKQLSDVFTPKYWSNTKQMQAVWDMVSAEGKKQLDGKEGRPSFQTRKNHVMAETVKRMLHLKKNKGGKNA